MSGMDSKVLTVSELFGPTFQGEGPSAGMRCMFVRLGRCNLDCKWCDTPYTWDWQGKNGVKYDPQALRRMSIGEVHAELLDLVAGARTTWPPLTVITGGEPMVQRALLPLVDSLCSDSTRVEIETNGTFEPCASLAAFAHFNVSPKLQHSGVDPALAINSRALGVFACLAAADRAAFKFVATCEADLDEVDALTTQYGVPSDCVYIMPEGRTARSVQDGMRALAQHTLDRGYNLTGRMHVTLWEDKRGV